MYGDFQDFAGKTLQEIEGLELEILGNIKKQWQRNSGEIVYVEDFQVLKALNEAIPLDGFKVSNYLTDTLQK